MKLKFLGPLILILIVVGAIFISGYGQQLIDWIVWQRSLSALPAEINFYKGVTLSMNHPLSVLEEAQKMGANIVDFGIPVYKKEDGSWVLGNPPSDKSAEKWQETATRQIREAHARGMHVAATLWVSTDITIKDPQIWLDHAKPLYREFGEFAAQNNIYMIAVPGEVENVIGATCCSPKPGVELTSNNELSAEGFAYWSSKISHELKGELRKNFKGHIAAGYIAGNWWFEGKRFVGLNPWDMEGFHAIISGIQFDDPAFVDDVAGVSYRRAKVLREVAKRSRIDKVIFEGPPINAMLRYTRGEGFELTDEERKPLYNLFFKQTHKLVDGYFMPKFPPPHDDPVLMEVAKDWYEKL